MDDATTMKCFKLDSKFVIAFGITLPKGILMFAFFAVGIKLGEGLSNLAGLALGLLLATVVYFTYNLFTKFFPGKRLTLLLNFFSQGDIYIPRQDKRFIPVEFFEEEP